MIPRLNIRFSLKDFVSMFRKPTDLWEEDNLFFLNHARSGITLAIESLNLSSDEKVGVMLYNCDTVMNAASNLGHELVFIDVDNNLRINQEDLSKKVNQISVLVLTHLFGLVNDVESIKTKYPDLIIIEDCAHAWGSKLGSGEDVGTVGDFAVFSTGMAKFPSIGDGGILRVNNKEQRNRVEEIYRNLPPYTIANNVQLLVKMILNSIAYSALIYKLITKQLKAKRTQSETINVRYKLQSKKMSVLVKNRLLSEQKLIETYKTKQVLNASIWKEFLEKNYPASRVIANDSSNYFMLPVWCSNPNILITDLALRGVEIATHFEKSLLWAKQFEYKSGICPYAESLIKHIVQLPCHYNIKEDKLKRILA